MIPVRKAALLGKLCVIFIIVAILLAFASKGPKDVRSRKDVAHYRLPIAAPLMEQSWLSSSNVLLLFNAPSGIQYACLDLRTGYVNSDDPISKALAGEASVQNGKVLLVRTSWDGRSIALVSRRDVQDVVEVFSVSDTGLQRSMNCTGSFRITDLFWSPSTNCWIAVGWSNGVAAASSAIDREHIRTVLLPPGIGGPVGVDNKGHLCFISGTPSRNGTSYVMTIIDLSSAPFLLRQRSVGLPMPRAIVEMVGFSPLGSKMVWKLREPPLLPRFRFIRTFPYVQLVHRTGEGSIWVSNSEGTEFIHVALLPVEASLGNGLELAPDSTRISALVGKDIYIIPSR